MVNGRGCSGTPSGMGGNDAGVLSGSRAVDLRGSTPFRNVVNTSGTWDTGYARSFLTLILVSKAAHSSDVLPMY